MMAWALSYGKIIIPILAAFALWGWGYTSGMRSIEAEWEKNRAAQLERNITVNNEVTNAYSKELADLRKRYDDFRLRTKGRLRLSKAACATDATAAADGLPDGVGEAVTSLMYQADEQTKQLIALQEWIRKIGQ